MSKIRTAWLALLLLGSISAVAAMFTGTWRAPAVADAMPDQAIALAEPGNETQAGAINWPDTTIRQDTAARQEMAARQAVDPDPMPSLRRQESAVTPFPAAPESIASAHAIVNANASANANMNIMGRHWRDANAVNRMPVATTQQLKKIRDSKAEMMRTKRSKAAANTKTCAPPSNALASLFRKLSLAPSCTI